MCSQNQCDSLGKGADVNWTGRAATMLEAADICGPLTPNVRTTSSEDKMGGSVANVLSDGTGDVGAVVAVALESCRNDAAAV